MIANPLARRVLLVALAGLIFATPVLAEDPPPDPLDEIRGLIKQGKYADAENEARKLLEEVSSQHGVESPEAAAVMDALVESLWRGGKVQEAETQEMAERVIALKKKMLGPDHVDVAESLTNFGVISFFLGDFKASRDSWEHGLAIREAALGADHPDVAQLLNNLANLALTIGDLGAAQELNEQALRIREEAFGPEHPLVAQSLTNLAIAMTESGEYAGALPVLERSLEIKGKLIGTEHPRYASSQVALARALAETGNYERSLALFEQAVQRLEQALGTEHPEVGAAVNNQAEILRKFGKYDEARPLYDRALAIYEGKYGPENALVAIQVGNLGYLEEVAGNIEGAIKLHERAVAIREKTLAPDDPALALSLNNLATIRAKSGDYETARPLFEQALEIRRDSLGPEHPLVAESLNGLARLAAETGDMGEALVLALQSERIARDHLRLTGRSLSEELALSYAAIRESGLDLALTLAASGLESSAMRSVLDALIRSRAVILDGIAARNRGATMVDDPEIARLAEELSVARTKLANMTVRGPGRLDTATFRELLGEARDEKERTERALAVASADFARELERGRVGVDEVTASLPSSTALMAFAVYGKMDLTPVERSEDTAKPPTSREPAPHYIAIVLPAGSSAPVAVDLGPASDLERTIGQWKKEISTGASSIRRTPEEPEAVYRRIGVQLRESVWDPVFVRVKGVERVFVVPDGAMNLVSFAGLPVGEDEYLVERATTVHYLSAERDLVPPREAAGVGVGLLALGGPDYDDAKLFATQPELNVESGDAGSTHGVASSTRGSRAACGDFETLHFDALPAAARESKEIVALWQEAGLAGAADSEEPGVLHLTGSTASEEAFKSGASGRRVLHLATHGFFLGGDCATTAGSRGFKIVAESEPEVPQVGPPASPLLLSGLALAGANHRRLATAEQEDGILTAEEVSALDLSGVEWAVLSACDTGAGEIQAGEGVFGLRRAMQVAGVRSMIMSLWPVDDEATRSWMKALYDGRLRDGLDTAEAVREAGISILRERRESEKSTHPFYWAAFVAAGDWR
jgi:CHAT domain-containing protein/tetratricopeptide (TPR) repeat protein